MSLSEDMMTVGVCKNVADALRREGCNGCVHDKLGCGRRDRGEYCGTIHHDGADVIDHLCTKLQERDAAAEELQKVKAELEQVKAERDRYWDWIRAMGCETCSGDCGKCDGTSGWTWSGEDYNVK